MDRLYLFRDKVLVRHICGLIAFYTYFKTESYVFSLSKNNYFLTEQGKDVKSTYKGKLGDKEMTLSEVKSLFINIKNADPSPLRGTGEYKEGSDKEFCLLANGF